ncbi:hypothetical protein HK100_007733 [Physocladia obscura]|uniref:Uncharacterized protein n=1 Tax=Physocladia obscura TaxID=109957 RepID=A0AAD5T5J6_9FUNG|nr:hypothetical protein HK100_007733 [Physocladia obscura]
MEDLTPGWKEKTAYTGDFAFDFNLDSTFQEPRFVRPKMDASKYLEKMIVENAPKQSDVDKFLYVSLYQATYDSAGTKSSPFVGLEKKVRTPNKSKTSLYQDSFENPRENKNELKLLDNRSNRTGNARAATPPQQAVSTLLHLVKDPAFSTSYVNDYITEHPSVEAGAGPSFPSTEHPMQTRQIVKKAFKYRRYG